MTQDKERKDEDRRKDRQDDEKKHRDYSEDQSDKKSSVPTHSGGPRHPSNENQ